MVNELDPALRRAIFLGWSQSMSTEKRVEHMDKFMKEKFSTFRMVDFGHEYTGPYNNKKLYITKKKISIVGRILKQ